MTAALIIDLDDTLADTSGLAAMRQSRRWRDCVKNINLAASFDQISETIASLRSHNIKVGIVTASVSFYAEALLRHLDVSYDTLVAYHDCSPRKPHPAPIVMAMQRLSCSPDATIGVGDAFIDCDAYQAAGIPAWGAGWSAHLDRTADWDKLLDSPTELLEHFLP